MVENEKKVLRAGGAKGQSGWARHPRRSRGTRPPPRPRARAFPDPEAVEPTLCAGARPGREMVELRGKCGRGLRVRGS